MQDGCLVGLWVTNRERHLRFIHDELLPHWKLSLVATWYWLKVTGRGELVSPLVCWSLACLHVSYVMYYASFTSWVWLKLASGPSPAYSKLSGVYCQDFTRVCCAANAQHLDSMLCQCPVAVVINTA